MLPSAAKINTSLTPVQALATYSSLIFGDSTWCLPDQLSHAPLLEVSMRRHFTGSAALWAALIFSSPTEAFGHAGDRRAESSDEPAAEDDGDGDEGDLILEEDEMDAEAPPAKGETQAGADVKFDTSFLGDGSSKAEAEAGADAVAKNSADGATNVSAIDQERIDRKMIIVVQRQAFLNVFKREDGKKVRRVELQPQFGLSVNDPYVRHYSVGLEANLWLTNRLALGLHGHGFLGAETSAYDRIRYQEGMLITANQYLWQASAAITYEPFYGKIAVFNRSLMHWEANTQLGGGVIHSRILPRFGKLHDPFDHILPQGNIGVGARFYLEGADFVSFNFMVRTWAWMDKYEPRNRGPATSGEGDEVDDPALDDAEAAKAQSFQNLAFNTMLYLGISLYLPPRFRYSTRR
ncbi:MAG: hypothetical protein V3V08_06685 [Nannocystaceae bacterium]